MCINENEALVLLCALLSHPNIYARFWCSHISHGIHFGRFTLFVKMQKIEDVRKIQGVHEQNKNNNHRPSHLEFCILIYWLSNTGLNLTVIFWNVSNIFFYISINFGGCATEKMLMYFKIVTETLWYCNFWRMFLVICCHADSWRV